MSERLAFGRPLDASEDQVIHLAPRPMTALLGRFALAAILVHGEIEALLAQGEEVEPCQRGDVGDGDAPVGAPLGDRGRDRVVRLRLVVPALGAHGAATSA